MWWIIPAVLVVVFILWWNLGSHCPPPLCPSLTCSPEEQWKTILEKRVDEEGRVDFAGLAREPEALNQLVSHLANWGPESNPKDFPDLNSRLAHYINSYNALCMHHVVRNSIPRSLGGLRLLSFFIRQKLKIDGRWISLYNYENKVILPLGEVRLHFALNCMSAGCPRLPQKPFTAENLDQELEREGKFFFSEERNLQVYPKEKRIRLSQILMFNGKDFLKQAPTLIDFINKYREEPIPVDYKIKFIPYDWTVKRQPE